MIRLAMRVGVTKTKGGMGIDDAGQNPYLESKGHKADSPSPRLLRDQPGA